ncbi:MAG TPA: WD40 repeat domain-containing serine/threonine protein kinase [Dongiaceae bacterium]|nr:WD40 repeat domain-containing serine/threonine protein kinase [Dongiaceae bacterium]
MIGRLIGHYRVLEQIGAGGMGEVFRARDERLGRDVALKLVRPASSENPDHLRRFEQEARAAAALNHPNIVAIYDVGFDGSTPYIVAELLEGRTLRVRLGEGLIPLRQAAGYALQIVQGLSAAHDRHIVHRDLKPENLFLTNDDRIKILDFGVAKLQPHPEENRSVENLTTITKHGAVIGTVAYMSPEQLRGKVVDHRSDIFSFGAILYEMLSGKRAFRGETEVDTMTAVLREEPPAANLEHADIPPAYQEIVRHCLEKEPDNRFQSAKDLVFALQTISGSASTSFRSGSGRISGRPKKAAPWVLAAAFAVIAAGLIVARIVQRPAASPQYSRLTFESGTIYSARFSPDGQSIVYAAAWNNKPVRLFTTVGNSLLSQPLQLSDSILLGISRKQELALAVGGKHTGQLESEDAMLASAPVAGGAPKELLADVRWADWDAQDRLAVVHYVDGQSRLEYPIGNLLYKSVGWISNIRISPSGDRIAFMDHPVVWDNRGAVSIVDLSGHARKLCGPWENESGLAWRPDGKEIWFSAAGKGSNLNLMAVDLSGKVRTLLDIPSGLTLQDISADGRVLISLTSTRLAMGFASLGNQEDIDLSWHDWNSARDISSDGQFVVFEDSSDAAGPNYAVAMRSVDGSLPIRLGEGSSGNLSSDGKWVASISVKEDALITLLPVGPGQPRPIQVKGIQHVQNGSARFMPDDKELTVNGDDAGHASRCYLVEIASGNARPITPEGTHCGPISPDGRYVVSKSGGAGLQAYPIAGGPVKILAENTRLNPVQWSKDGLWLYGYHVGEFPTTVYKLNLATGKETPVQVLRPGSPAGVVMLAPVVVCRDGERFAYSYNQTLSVLYLVSGLR